MKRIALFTVLIVIASCVEKKTPLQVSKPAKTMTAAEREVLVRENGLLKDGFFGYTALIHASYKGDTNEVRRLVEQGVDMNWKMQWGYTALMWAANQGHMDVVGLLVERGADVNARNEDGFTALMLAKREGRSAVVDLLLAHGAKGK